MVLTRAGAAREAGTDAHTIQAGLESDGENTRPLTRARATLKAKAAKIIQVKDEKTAGENSLEMSESGQQDGEAVEIKTEAGVGGHVTAFEEFLRRQVKADQARVQHNPRHSIHSHHARLVSRVKKARIGSPQRQGVRRRERARNCQILQQHDSQVQPRCADPYKQSIRQDDLDDVLDDILKTRAGLPTEFDSQADFIPLGEDVATNVLPQHKIDLFQKEIMKPSRMQMILEETNGSKCQQGFERDFFDPGHAVVAKSVTASNAVSLAFNRLKDGNATSSMKPAVDVAASAGGVTPLAIKAAEPIPLPNHYVGQLSKECGALLRLQVILGYKFTNTQRLIEAVFTLQKLFGKSNMEETTAKLRWIGSRTIGLAVMQAGYHDRNMTPDRLLAHYSSARENSSLATAVRKCGLKEFGPPGQDEDGTHKNMLTAIIGAVQVDGGLDAATAVMKKLGVF